MMMRAADQFDELDIDFQTKHNARASYIAWRMADLPGLYQNLLPLTADAAELWDAEKRIRAQHQADLEFSASPWRRVGPPSTLLDLSGLTAQEIIVFGAEVKPYAGLNDRPKPGREADVKEEIERGRQRYAAEHPDTHAPIEGDETIKLLDHLSPGEAAFAASIELPRAGGKNDLRNKNK